jgi:hypothetical protein
MRISCWFCFFALALWPAVIADAYAQNQPEALQEITDTADRICGSVAAAGQGTDVKITGDVKAQLSGLAKKLADLGISGAGDVTTGSYEGVLRDQLATVLSEQRNCKLAVFQSLLNVVFPPRPQTPSRATRNPDSLYQYDEAVADGIGGVVDQASGLVKFQAIRSTGKADPSREFEYRDWVLLCPDVSRPPPNAVVGQFIGMTVGATCRIVRKSENK